MGVLPQYVVDRFVTNEGREEVPGRLLRTFDEDSVVTSVTTPPSSRPRIQILRETPKRCVFRTSDEQVVEWKEFYKKLGWTLNEPGLIVPERRVSAGFVRMLVVINCLTKNQVYEWNDASFSCWRFNNDLNTAIPEDDRFAVDKPYVVWVRDGQEPDSEHLGKSAKLAWRESLKGETFIERGLHESKYFQETGRHLDLVGVTIVTGSRYSADGVPGCYWHDCWDVDRYDVDYQHGTFGPREVSL